MTLAIFCADYSTPLFNRWRPLRVSCRFAYRTIGELFIVLKLSYEIDEGSFFYDENGNQLPARSIYPICDYPLPYRSYAFGLTPERDDYLITDPANFVIRRSTSYCAWKIRQTIGRWPKKRRKRRYDAKDWGEFLELNGFHQVDIQKTDPGLHTKESHYIGVAPNDGGYGQLYWLHWYDSAEKYGYDHADLGYICSTYKNFRPTLVWIDIERSDITWYQIC